MLVQIPLMDKENIIDACLVPAQHAALPVQHKYSGNKLQWCGSDARGTQKAITCVGHLWMTYGD